MRRPWTDEEEEFLRSNAHRFSIRELMEKLIWFNYNWRSYGAVHRKLSRMGLNNWRRESDTISWNRQGES